MKWFLKQGNILDEVADVLVCSANVSLNLSGGVGGEILVCYGDAMQKELRAYLEERDINAVPRGTVVATSSCGTNFKHVLHAVAVNPFYDSSARLIESTVGKALAEAAELGAQTVALAALATGYGRLTMTQFADGIRPLIGKDFGDIKRVVVCVLDIVDYHELCRSLPDVGRAGDSKSVQDGSM
jgi:O-acetyl-ADP-ribose deacetylase (regulator of RNase III)